VEILVCDRNAGLVALALGGGEDELLSVLKLDRAVF